VIDPPVVGRFEDGEGRFECDDVLDGVTIRVRYDWKNIGPTAITWEQLFSFDGGATWDRNWIMESTRIGPEPEPEAQPAAARLALSG
jgi:hypothetical protein